MPIWSNPIHSDGAQFGHSTLLAGDSIIGKNLVSDYFYDFWNQLNQDGKKPSRADIRPTDMKQYLDRLVLMDVEPKTEGFRLSVKLIGSHVAAFYGELAGQDIDEMDNEKAIGRIYATCSKVLETEQPVLSVTTGISQNKAHLEGFALYMPLFSPEGHINKIMASVDIRPVVKTMEP